jgi:DNA-binding transcriptional MerR regulator/effector-binding domain-containing protein
MKLKIGEFARLGQVSVSALRYYSDAGLLKPAHTDRWTGYRYYDLDQLPSLNRILALKDLGLSLEDIGRLMGDELAPEQIRALLRVKQAELREQTRELIERLSRVEARIQQIELEGKMPDYDVVVKRVGPIRGAALHDTLVGNQSGDMNYTYLFDEVADHMRKNGATKSAPVIDLWYDLPGNLPDEMRVTVVIPTDSDLPETDRVKVEVLPAVDQMVSVVHRGPFTTISAANVAALKWIERNGYRVNGPGRGVYLQYDRDGDPNDWVTEIQFPVEKST